MEMYEELREEKHYWDATEEAMDILSNEINIPKDQLFKLTSNGSEFRNKDFRQPLNCGESSPLRLKR